MAITKQPALNKKGTAKIRQRLQLLGVAIILGGLVAAFFNWHEQDLIERQARARQTNEFARADSAEPLAPDDSRRYTHDMEMYYGKTGLLMDRLTRTMERWTHGKPLSAVIAIGFLVVAGGCFFFAAAYSTTEQRKTKPGPHEGEVDRL